MKQPRRWAGQLSPQVYDKILGYKVLVHLKALRLNIYQDAPLPEGAWEEFKRFRDWVNARLCRLYGRYAVQLVLVDIIEGSLNRMSGKGDLWPTTNRAPA